MKKLFLSLVLILISLLKLSAQTDTLLINLKTGASEKIAVSQIQKIQFENVPSAVEEQFKLSNGLAVKGNYPNPFGEQTSIEFEIASFGNVEVMIYDNSGNQIQTLKCQNCQVGKNTLQWNCLDKNNERVQSGVYFYEVHFGKEVQAKKMLVIGGGK